MMPKVVAQNQLRRRNTFKSAVKQLLQAEYRFLGGDRVQELFVSDLLDLQDKYLMHESRLDAGQLLWWAVDKDDKPARGKTLEQTRMVPVRLTLASEKDVAMVLEGRPLREIRRHRMVRFLQEAYEQGGVLAQSDLCLLLASSSSWVSSQVRRHQEEEDVVLPYRGTIHDLGRALTHKRIIVGLFLQNVPTPEIARRTRHSMQSCDAYIKAFKRVRRLFLDGMQEGNIAAELDMSLGLVREYLEIVRENGAGDEEGGSEES